MNEATYVPVKDGDGYEYLCPVTAAATFEAAADGSDHSDCVEKDVVERYSGNIEIR